MKKLMIIALALIFMVPAISVFAGELTIGGSYRVTWTKYDPGWAGFDTANSEGPDDIDYFQQRIRIPFTWKANDNVSFFMRTDWSEGGFGNAVNLTSVDYAYATIKHDTYQLRIGMQERNYGNNMMYNPDLYGFALDLFFGDMTASFDYGKQSEGGSNLDNTILGTNDTDLYAAKFQYSTDALTVGGMIAQEDNSIRARDVRRGYGAFVKIPVGAMTIKSEINVFDGDNGGTGVAKIDYFGTQFLFDIAIPLSETASIGVTAVYAKGDDAVDEQQITTVNAGAGSFGGVRDFQGALWYDEHFGFGHMFPGGSFEPQANAGILGAVVRARFKVADPVTLYAKAGWLTTEEDDVNGPGVADLEDIIFVNVSVDYAWQPNVTVSLGGYWEDADFDENVYDEPKVAFVARLGINF